MAIVTITVDTEENTLKATIDGKDVNDVTSASAYVYNDYYTKNKPKVSWNVSANNATNDDDFTSYVNYCSATASVTKTGDIQINLSGTKKVLENVKASLTKEVIDRARAATVEYFDKKRGR